MFMKIFTAGHEVPSDETILSFKRAVRRFLRDNADNGLSKSVSDKLFKAAVGDRQTTAPFYMNGSVFFLF